MQEIGTNGDGKSTVATPDGRGRKKKFDYEARSHSCVGCHLLRICYCKLGCHAFPREAELVSE